MLLSPGPLSLMHILVSAVHTQQVVSSVSDNPVLLSTML